MAIILSKTSWETSFFGGFSRIIYDHPELTVPLEIDHKFGTRNKNNLSWYTQTKLVNIFLLKIHEHGLLDDMLLGGEVKKEKKFFKEENIFYVNKNTVKNCLNRLLRQNEDELHNLFAEYAQDLADVQFTVTLPPDPEDDKGGGEGEDEEGESEGGGGFGADGDDENDEDQDDQDGDGEGDGEDRDSEKEKERKQQEKEKKEQEKKRKEEERKKKEEEAKNKPAGSKDVKYAKSKFEKITTRKPFSNSYVYTDDGHVAAAAKFKQMSRRTRPTSYNSNEIRDAKALVNLLDINFDPKSDKIQNLKTGKLNPSKVAEIPAGNTHVYYREEENQSTKPFGICILADESGSMGGSSSNSNMSYQHTLLKTLYKAFSDIVPQDRIYIYGHSGDYTPEIRVYQDKYNPYFEYTIDNQFNNSNSSNYDGPVIERIYEKIREQTSDNIIFIAISDGQPAGCSYGGNDAIADLNRIIEKCKRDGFVTLGVGMDAGYVKEIYHYHTIVRRNEGLVKKVSTLINRVVKTEFQD